MTMLDISRGDAFSLISYTNAIQNLQFVPGYVNSLGLFQTRGIATIDAFIEERDDMIVIASPLPRGGPGQTAGALLRRGRTIRVPHFQFDDGLLAETVQGIRAWGTETAVEMFQEKLMERAAMFRQGFEITDEFIRLDAITKGVITYQDGTTLDLYALMGKAQMATVALDLAHVNPAGGILRRNLMNLISRALMDQLGGLPCSGIFAICGNAFFDDLIQHSDVRTTYLNTIEAADLRTAYLQAPNTPSSMVYGSFRYADINWVNYRGTRNGLPLVDPDMAYFIPMGVPNMFQTVLAPADYLETVNTIGLPMYAKQWTMDNDKGVNLEFQTNKLHYCTRPQILMRATRLVAA
jgi:Phage major capsid protein E